MLIVSIGIESVGKKKVTISSMKYIKIPPSTNVRPSKFNMYFCSDFMKFSQTKTLFVRP